MLARAGLLDDKVCTLHWENIPSFRETYPDIEVTDDLFEIDNNRFTCSGGFSFALAAGLAFGLGVWVAFFAT